MLQNNTVVVSLLWKQIEQAYLCLIKSWFGESVAVVLIHPFFNMSYTHIAVSLITTDIRGEQIYSENTLAQGLVNLFNQNKLVYIHMKTG